MLHERRIEDLRAEIEELERQARTPEAQRASRAQQAKICDIEELPDIPTAGTAPWSHQLRAYWFLYHKLGLGLPQPEGGALLAMDMGTGKTKVAIDVIQNGTGEPILIGCPLAVVPTWPDEFGTHYGGRTPVRLSVLQKGSVAKRTREAAQAWEAAAAAGHQAVFVINHESMWREPFRSFVLKKKWQGLIIDECHRAKSPGGKFSKFTQLASHHSSWRLGLTGTPMPRDQMDIYAQGRFLDSSVFGTNFTEHKTRYGNWIEIPLKDSDGNPKKDRWGKDIVARKLVGVRNDGELQSKLDFLSYRVKADDVLDLPPAITQTRTCTLSADEKRVYKELETDLIAEIDGGFVTASNALTKILRLQQVVQGTMQDEEGNLHKIGSSKARLLKDVLMDIKTNEPVVVFCRFHTCLDQVHEAAKDVGRRSLELSGRCNQLEEFKEGSGGEVIAVQIQSGGVGVDLSRAAYSIYFAPTYDGGAYEQSLRRTRRPTKHLHGSYIYIQLVAEGSIDVLTYQALDRKKKVTDYVLAGIRGRT